MLFSQKGVFLARRAFFAENFSCFNVFPLAKECFCAIFFYYPASAWSWPVLLLAGGRLLQGPGGCDREDFFFF